MRKSWFCGALFPRLTSLALALALLLLTLPSSAAAADWRERPTNYAVIYYPPQLSNSAEQLAAMIDPIIEEVAAIHHYTPGRLLPVRLHPSAESYGQTSPLARTSFGEIAQVSQQTGELDLDEPKLRNLTPEQIRNFFRRGISQLILDDQTKDRMPIGFLTGAALYTEHVTPEVEVRARLLDDARRNRQMLSWADLNQPDKFVVQPDIAVAQGYAVVAFLLDRYGLNPWQHFVGLLPSQPDYAVALAQAYGKPVDQLEQEWLAYLPEYFGGSYNINYFNRYSLEPARALLTDGRYFEARDEAQAVARFIAGADRADKENEIRELASQIERGLEANSLLTQGQQQMAAFDYAAARDSFQQASQRFESVGATTKVDETSQAIASAESGIAALTQLSTAQSLLAEVKYAEAYTAASEASKTFAALGDAEHYRQAAAVLQSLSMTQTYIAYALGIGGLLFVVFAFWRLRVRARRLPIPGVLR